MENQKFVVYKPHNEKGSKNIREYVIYPVGSDGNPTTPGAILVRPRESFGVGYQVLSTNTVEKIDEFPNIGICQSDDLGFLLREYFRNEELKAKARDIILAKPNRESDMSEAEPLPQ